MRFQNQHYEMALDVAQVGVWTWCLDTQVVEWDSRMRMLYGLDGGDTAFNELFVERVHPDDREATIQEMGELASGVINGEVIHSFQRDIRIIHPRLGERWIRSAGRIERNAGGEVCRIAGVNFDITNIERTEDALRRSEEKYRNLNQNMMEGYAVANLDGHIVESNPAFQELLGYTELELSEFSYMDLTPEKWHSMEMELIEPQVLSRGFSDLYEKEYITKDGHLIAVELRAYLIRNQGGEPEGMWAMIRDITERKRTDGLIREWNETLERRVGERTMELQQSEARFRQLSESTFEGSGISAAGVILDGNLQVASMFGYEHSEVIGRPMMDFVAPESRELVATHVRNDWEEAYEFWGLRKDGSKFPAEAHARMGMWDGNKTRITALRDLTASKEAEAKLLRQRDELDQAMRLATISEVSAGIVHQLGQPISVIGNLLATVSLRSEDEVLTTEDLFDSLEKIRVETDRMRDVVTHLRALTNPGKKPDTRIDFNAMVEGVIPMMRLKSEEWGLKLVVELAADLPEIIADAVQLSQVVINLVDNAFDACMHCPIERRVIKLQTCGIPGKGVVLLVGDQGVGIEAGVMEHMFSPMFTTKSGGLGMGLRLSQAIVSSHGGDIEASNNPDGMGSTFRVFLPENNR